MLYSKSYKNDQKNIHESQKGNIYMLTVMTVSFLTDQKKNTKRGHRTEI